MLLKWILHKMETWKLESPKDCSADAGVKLRGYLWKLRRNRTELERVRRLDKPLLIRIHLNQRHYGTGMVLRDCRVQTLCSVQTLRAIHYSVPHHLNLCSDGILPFNSQNLQFKKQTPTIIKACGAMQQKRHCAERKCIFWMQPHVMMLWFDLRLNEYLYI